MNIGTPAFAYDGRDLKSGDSFGSVVQAMTPMRIVMSQAAEAQLSDRNISADALVTADAVWLLHRLEAEEREYPNRDTYTVKHSERVISVTVHRIATGEKVGVTSQDFVAGTSFLGIASVDEKGKFWDCVVLARDEFATWRRMSLGEFRDTFDEWMAHRKETA